MVYDPCYVSNPDDVITFIIFHTMTSSSTRSDVTKQSKSGQTAVGGAVRLGVLQLLGGGVLVTGVPPGVQVSCVGRLHAAFFLVEQALVLPAEFDEYRTQRTHLVKSKH